jgi:hypothetical protein
MNPLGERGPQGLTKGDLRCLIWGFPNNEDLALRTRHFSKRFRSS